MVSSVHPETVDLSVLRELKILQYFYEKWTQYSNQENKDYTIHPKTKEKLM